MTTLTILRDATKKSQTQFNSLEKVKLKDIWVPDKFDGTDVWGKYLSPVKKQGECGGCWAYASTGTLSDRFNIQSDNQLHINLSPAKLILCNFLGLELINRDEEKEKEINKAVLEVAGCYGNTLYDAWRYLYIFGAPTETCLPSQKIVSNPSILPFCEQASGRIGDMCYGSTIDMNTELEYGTPARFYRCIHFYAVSGIEKDKGSELNIRREIYTWGPVSTGFVLYPDFYLFDAKNEVYEWNGKGEPVSGHSVEIVGWDIEDNGKPYWIVKNSWGDKWGDGGYFYIRRGVNMCQIEENVITGLPDFFYPANYVFPIMNSWGESEDMEKVRDNIDYQVVLEGGGINPETGFTRRVELTKPWFDTTIKKIILPEWKSYKAGEQIQKRKKTFPLWLIFCIGILLMILFIKIRRKSKNNIKQQE